MEKQPAKRAPTFALVLSSPLPRAKETAAHRRPARRDRAPGSCRSWGAMMSRVCHAAVANLVHGLLLLRLARRARGASGGGPGRPATRIYGVGIDVGVVIWERPSSH